MKKSVLILILFGPVFLFAQKGIIVPDVNPPVVSSVPNDTKLWTIEYYLLNCPDGTSKCYLVKENGINKTVPVDDVYDFVFEEGYTCTVWVKEELKTPPIVSSAGIYTYTVMKTVSRKSISSDASTIPTVSANTPVITPTAVVSATDKSMVNTYETDYKARIEEEIKSLKKQVSDLKKQVDVLQLQLELQLQLLQKK